MFTLYSANNKMLPTSTPNQYGHRTLIGNWFEDQTLYEHKVQDYLERKKRKEEADAALAALGQIDPSTLAAGTVLASVRFDLLSYCPYLYPDCLLVSVLHTLSSFSLICQPIISCYNATLTPNDIRQLLCLFPSSLSYYPILFLSQFSCL